MTSASHVSRPFRRTLASTTLALCPLLLAAAAVHAVEPTIHPNLPAPRTSTPTTKAAASNPKPLAAAPKPTAPPVLSIGSITIAPPAPDAAKPTPAHPARSTPSTRPRNHTLRPGDLQLPTYLLNRA